MKRKLNRFERINDIEDDPYEHDTQIKALRQQKAAVLIKTWRSAFR